MEQIQLHQSQCVVMGIELWLIWLLKYFPQDIKKKRKLQIFKWSE